ncbi:MAG: OadG family transporter subunit [Terrimicrobiaceae bacterium]
MNGLLPVATESVNGRLEFFTNLQYQTVGILIVITSLCVLAFLVTVVARGLSFVPKAKKPEPEAPEAPAVVIAEGISPEIRAVIAAAVHVSLKSPHRILHVDSVPNPQLHAWSVEGRRQIFQSHSFR